MQQPPENDNPFLDRPPADRPATDAPGNSRAAAPIEDEYTAIPVGRSFVLTIIATTMAVTVIAISLIYYRWLTVGRLEPVSAIVVQGDESLGPTQLTVASNDYPTIKPPDLTEENKFVTPVLLHPGTYVLTAKQNDHVLIRIPFKIEPHRGISFRLPSPQRKKEEEDRLKAEASRRG